MEEIKKIYWSMGEVSQMLSWPGSKIRFLTKVFDFDRKIIRRGQSRRFCEQDIALLHRIKFLKDEGFTLAGIKKRL